MSDCRKQAPGTSIYCGLFVSWPNQARMSVDPVGFLSKHRLAGRMRRAAERHKRMKVFDLDRKLVGDYELFLAAIDALPSRQHTLAGGWHLCQRRVQAGAFQRL